MSKVTVVVGEKAYYSHLITDSDIQSFGSHCPGHNNGVTSRECGDCSGYNSSYDGTGGDCWHWVGNKGGK